MASKYMKKCSIPLTIKEMQIKTELRFYLTTVRMAIIKKQQQMLERMWGKRKLSIQCWWGCNLVHQYGNLYGGSIRN
jgi:hypothetical protein